MNTTKHVLLWSQRQNALHVETMTEHLRRNFDACAANAAGDYRLLAVGTREQCDEAAAGIHAVLRGRSDVRSRVAA